MSNLSTAQRGRDLVLDELRRRGAVDIDVSDGAIHVIRATSRTTGKTVNIRCKTRTAGTWQASTKLGTPGTELADERDFWVFVDLADDSPHYFIAPDWWVRNDIYQAHQAYLEKHGGRRARTDLSDHHAIQPARIAVWHDRWDILDLA